MPKHLIYTSYPTGVQSGRSGFQTVAIHGKPSKALIQLLEKESSYEFGRSDSYRPTISRYWKASLEDTSLHILSRHTPSGTDATGRPNHLSQHLVFESNELPACPPPALFLWWGGWVSRWEGEGYWSPERFPLPELDDSDPFAFRSQCTAASTWKKCMGDRSLPELVFRFNDADCVLFPFPEGQENTVLHLFAESMCVAPGGDLWTVSFTTCLGDGESTAPYRWAGWKQDASGNPQVPYAEDKPVAVIEAFSKKNPTPPPPPSAPAPPQTLNPAVKTSMVTLTPMDDPPANRTSAPTGPLFDNEPILTGALADGSAPARHLHPEGILDDIFAKDTEPQEKIVIPEIDFDTLPPETSRNASRPFWAALTVVGVLGSLAILIFLFPKILGEFNRSRMGPLNPSTLTQDTIPGTTQREFEPVVFRDPLADRPESILAANQFVPARSYLIRNQGDPELRDDPELKRLAEWIATQQDMLRFVNKTLDTLDQEIASRQLIHGFDERVRALKDEMEKLAADLHANTVHRVERAEASYRTWLKDSRLPMDEAPLFYMQFSSTGTRPSNTFEGVNETMREWMNDLNETSATSQIEHIQVDIIPFRGLGEVSFPTENRLPLSFWKKAPGSFVCSLDKSIEILQFRSLDPEHRIVRFDWVFDYLGSVTSGNQLIRFPSPPLFIRFRNTQSGKSFFVLCNSATALPTNEPPDIPSTLLSYDDQTASFTLEDPVLARQLRLISLPDNLFLRLRSQDDRFHFAWSPDNASFQIFETWDFEIQSVQSVQEAIGREYSELRHLQRMQQVRTMWGEFTASAFWDMGTRLLEPMPIPDNLRNFGAFSRDRPVSYLDYLKAILTHYARERTMVRPQILEQWLAFEEAPGPDQNGRIKAYRDLLTRAARRFRTLLQSEQPDLVEHWRLMVTTLEFHLLGHEDSENLFLQVASLTPGEIVLAESRGIPDSSDIIDRIRQSIESRNRELDAASNLSDIPSVNTWWLDVCSLSPDHASFPLLRFK